MKAGFSHESHAAKSVDWYTPQWVFDALGMQFDLDPCQPVGGVPWIPAARRFTEQDDGLAQPWHGQVWLNPPYGKQTEHWLRRMHEHRQGVALVFARTDCGWFHDYCAKADCILLLRGRIRFVDGLGVTAGTGPGSGSMLVGWGVAACIALGQMAGRGLLVSLAANDNQQHQAPDRAA